MIGALPALEMLIFAFALWLGCYLLNRDPGNASVRLAGLGLVAYGGILALDVLAAQAPTADVARALAGGRESLLFLPVLCWTGTVIYLLPADLPVRARLAAWWRYGLLPLIMLP